MLKESQNHSNYKSFEEAQTIWNKHVRTMDNDFIVLYMIPVKKEEDELITIEKIDTSETTMDKLTLIATGTKCVTAKANDLVTLNAIMMQNSAYPMMLEDCLFWVCGERAIIAYMN